MTFDDYAPDTAEGIEFKKSVFKAICDIRDIKPNEADESKFTFKMLDEDRIEYHIEFTDGRTLDSEIFTIMVDLAMEGCAETAVKMYYEHLCG